MAVAPAPWRAGSPAAWHGCRRCRSLSRLKLCPPSPMLPLPPATWKRSSLPRLKLPACTCPYRARAGSTLAETDRGIGYRLFPAAGLPQLDCDHATGARNVAENGNEVGHGGRGGIGVAGGAGACAAEQQAACRRRAEEDR